MRFRKKPVIVEAVQFTLAMLDREAAWPEGVCPDTFRQNRPYIPTLEGDMLVEVGDWIITGVNGERYPCKPDVFEKTYEPVECVCGHPGGWHFRGNGSCIECGCMKYEQKKQ